jgi:hypothetical protein
MSGVETTLKEREGRYGPYAGHAGLAQAIKDVMRASCGWERCDPSMREGLEMIAHKIARVLNGDPGYADNWHDIAGYATLVERGIKA